MSVSANIAKLLSFVLQPTRICIIIIIACVFVFVNHRRFQSNVGSDFTSADDATAAYLKTLQISLAVGGMHLVRFLCLRYVAKAVVFLGRVASLNRLLLTFITVTFVTVVIVVPVYYWMVEHIAWWSVSRLHSTTRITGFRGGETRLFRCQIVGEVTKVKLASCDLALVYDPVVFLRVFPLDGYLTLQPVTNAQLPRLFSKTYPRHSTEDVLLPCQAVIEVQQTADVQQLPHVQIWWTVEKGQLMLYDQRVSVLSDRRVVSWVPTQMEASLVSRQVFVQEDLLIRRLRDDDFGTYTCRVRASYNSSSSQHPALEQNRSTLSTRVSEVTLWKYFEATEEVSLYPAEEVHVEIVFRMLADSNDVVFTEHKINGINRHELPEADKCSQEVRFPFLDYSERLSNTYMKKSDPMGNTVLYERHKVCVEHYNYGLHTFTIRRQFYNPETRLEDFVETEFSEKVLVIPKLPRFFSDVKDNAYFSFMDLKECWENNVAVRSEYCTNRLSKLKAASRFHFFVDCSTTTIIYVLIHMYYVWWTYTLIKYVLTLTLPELFRTSVVNTLGTVKTTESESQSHSATDKKYDVFLAYADEDHWMSRRIRGVLQRYDLTVYDCHEDVPPCLPTLTAWDQGMENSSGFVAVVSPDYLRHPELHQQFQNIHHMMLDQQVSEDRLVLVMAGRCRIPSALGPLPVIDINLPHWGQQLEWWALRLKRRFSNEVVLQQMRRDFQRDSRDFLELSRRDSDVRQIFPQFSFLIKKVEAICESARLFGSEESSNRNNCRTQPGFRGQDDTASCQICSSDCSPRQTSLGYGHHVAADSDSTFHPSSRAEAEDEATSRDVPRLGSAAYESLEQKSKTSSARYDVFLTYCEESPSDRIIASQMKDVLEGRSRTYQIFARGDGLRVFDAAQDLLGGQPEVHVVSAAAQCATFVVLLSPAYCRSSLTRRLHFPQVLEAVCKDRLDVQDVLIVYTSGILETPPTGGDDVEEAVTASSGSPQAELYRLEFRERGVAEYAAEMFNDESFSLPPWFKAFTGIHWSPVLGLYEEEVLKGWATRLKSRSVALPLSDND